MERIDKPKVRLNDQEQRTVMNFVDLIDNLDKCLPGIDFNFMLGDFWNEFDEYVEEW